MLLFAGLLKGQLMLKERFGSSSLVASIVVRLERIVVKTVGKLDLLTSRLLIATSECLTP